MSYSGNFFSYVRFDRCVINRQNLRPRNALRSYLYYYDASIEGNEVYFQSNRQHFTPIQWHSWRHKIEIFVFLNYGAKLSRIGKTFAWNVFSIKWIKTNNNRARDISFYFNDDDANRNTLLNTKYLYLKKCTTLTRNEKLNICQKCFCLDKETCVRIIRVVVSFRSLPLGCCITTKKKLFN